jgi:hypothetical protein
MSIVTGGVYKLMIDPIAADPLRPEIALLYLVSGEGEGGGGEARRRAV